MSEEGVFPNTSARIQALRISYMRGAHHHSLVRSACPNLHEPKAIMANLTRKLKVHNSHRHK